LAQDLSKYQDNIRQKIADIRGVGRGGSVERVQQTVEDIKEEIAKGTTPRGTPAQPVVVQSEQVAGLLNLPDWIGSWIGSIATAGLVIVLVVFMLLERQDLRNRLIGIIGHGHLALTTKAFDEAAKRISRYLLMQPLVNLIFGLGVGTALPPLPEAPHRSAVESLERSRIHDVVPNSGS
jgi:predicted PurR-regulated permease PerM